MKQTIRLTESELRNLIAECVNETMLNEGAGGDYWDGDYHIIQDIYRKAWDLIRSIERNYWEELDNPNKYPMVVEVHRWAGQIAQDCKRYLDSNADYFIARRSQVNYMI